MGGGKGGGTTTQQTTTTIPPEVLQRYNAVNARAEVAANTPFQNYGGEFVAPVNPTQQGGIGTISNAAGTAGPYFGAATGQLLGGQQQAQPYFGTATGQVAQGLAGGQALNSQALNTLGGGLAGAQPFNTSAGQAFNTGYGGAQPYNMGATGLALAGTGAVNPGQLNIGQYMSPYNQAVVNSTLALVQQQQGQQLRDQTSNAILSGAYGGDRAGIQRSVLEGQQNLAYGNIASNLYNQNYQQALGAAQQQQGVGLGAAQANRAALQQGAGQLQGIGQQVYGQGLGYGQAQQGLGQQIFGQGLAGSQGQAAIGQQGFQQGLGAAQANLGIGQGLYGMGANTSTGLAGLGTGLLGTQLQQGQAQIGAGTIQQQTQQAQDQALYNQFLQQQGYPFQVAQFLANIAEGTGALSGSSTMANTTAPQPYFSDERLKDNIRTIGHTKDGLRIIRFNYKNEPNVTRIGMLAQDVEKKKPEAVGLAGGYKTVDYDRATRALGGAVANDDIGRGFADGGYADPQTLASILLAHQAMYPGMHDPAGISTGQGPRGMQLAQPSNRQLQTPTLPKVQEQEPVLRQGLQTAGDLAKAGTGVADLWRAGKDAVVGSPATRDAPASGGLLGTGGKWDPDRGWFGRQTGSGGLGAANTNAPITTTPLPPPEATPAPAAATGTVADAGSAISNDATSMVADAGTDLVDDALFLVARGGRIRRAAGGGMPYADYSYIPEDAYDPEDPQKLKSEQDAIARESKPPSEGGGGKSGGKDGTGKMLGSLAGGLAGMYFGPLGSMAGSALGGTLGGMFKNGGRAGYEEGGAPTNDDLPPYESPLKGRFERSMPPAVELPAYEPERIVPGLAGVRPVETPEPPKGLAAEPKSLKLPPRPEEKPYPEFDPSQPLRPGLAAAAAPPAAPAAQPPTAVAPPPTGLAPPPQSSTEVPPQVAFQNNVGKITTPDGKGYHGYATPQEGVAAAIRNVQAYPGRFNQGQPMSLLQIAQHWAPPDDGKSPMLRGNNPANWAKNVASVMGVPVDQPLNWADPKIAARFGPAVHTAEGGQRFPDSVYQEGSQLAFSGAKINPITGLPLGGGGGGAGAAGAGVGSQVGAALNVPAGGLAPAQGMFPGSSNLDLSLPSKETEKGSWIDRNERPIVAGLTFLGNMLGSRSHQLTGAIGEGLAAAAPAYAAMGFRQQEAGQRQQQIGLQGQQLDITAMAQRITLLNQLRTMQNARLGRGLPEDPALAAQIASLAGSIGGGRGGGPVGGTSAASADTPPAGPAGGPVTQTPLASPAGPLPNTPAGGAPAGSPPTTPPVADQQLAIQHPALAGLPPQAAQAPFLSRINPEDNPFELYKRADQIVDDGDPNGAHARAVARADAAARNLKELGYALDRNGMPVMVPGWTDTQRSKEMIGQNVGWTQKEGAANVERQNVRQSLDIIKRALEEYHTNALGEFSADVQRYMRAVGIDVGNTPKMNAAAVQELIKQSAATAARAGDTDMARNLSRISNIDPDKEPEANKQILAQAYSDLNMRDARYAHLQPRISAVPQFNTPDEALKWSQSHPQGAFYEDSYKNLGVMGATPLNDRGVPDRAKMKPEHTYTLTPEEATKLYKRKFTEPVKIRVERDGSIKGAQ